MHACTPEILEAGLFAKPAEESVVRPRGVGETHLLQKLALRPPVFFVVASPFSSRCLKKEALRIKVKKRQLANVHHLGQLVVWTR